MLTRAQWGKLIGEAAKDSKVLSDTIKQVVPKDRVEFSRKVLKAVAKMPLDADAKAVRYIESVIHCVANTSFEDSTKYGAIAEGIALAPVPVLPGLVKELSKRFDPKVNNLADERYREIAEKGVQACIDRNALVDETRVRNTFAILLFTRAAPIPGLQEALLALLPDATGRELAVGWLAAAAQDDYTDILAAAEAPIAPPMPAINMVGLPQTARLLAYMTLADSAEGALLIPGTGAGMFEIDIQHDAGIQQTPFSTVPTAPTVPPIVGYQNQGMSLTRPCWCN
ncbi:MAG: hypothetical protein FWG50_02020 [Kiritimatiellaeota bacterium]|nr:hypothetical protein [Kiritimatiellota bacterium]